MTISRTVQRINSYPDPAQRLALHAVLVIFQRHYEKTVYLLLTMKTEPVEEVARIPIGDESRGQFKQGSAGHIKLDSSLYKTDDAC
jgi:hypothetical protein